MEKNRVKRLRFIRKYTNSSCADITGTGDCQIKSDPVKSVLIEVLTINLKKLTHLPIT